MNRVSVKVNMVLLNPIVFAAIGEMGKAAHVTYYEIFYFH